MTFIVHINNKDGYCDHFNANKAYAPYENVKYGYGLVVTRQIIRRKLDETCQDYIIFI